MPELPVRKSPVRPATSAREALAAAVWSKETGSPLSHAAASLVRY